MEVSNLIEGRTYSFNASYLDNATNNWFTLVVTDVITSKSEVAKVSLGILVYLSRYLD